MVIMCLYHKTVVFPLALSVFLNRHPTCTTSEPRGSTSPPPHLGSVSFHFSQTFHVNFYEDHEHKYHLIPVIPEFLFIIHKKNDQQLGIKVLLGFTLFISLPFSSLMHLILFTSNGFVSVDELKKK